MNDIPKCFVCQGSILAGVCIMCNREVEPERISLGEAMLSNLTNENDPRMNGDYGRKGRQRPPLSVSLDRAARWMRGETAP